MLSLLKNISVMNTQATFTAIQDGKPILIYGAGNIGKDVSNVLRSHGANVVGFLDRKAVPGMEWNGIPIYPPDLAGLPGVSKDQFLVIIAIHNRDVPIAPIIQYLKEQAYSGIINLIEFYDYFSAEMGDRFWLTSRVSYQDWEADIYQGYSIWEDEESKKIYQQLIEARLKADYSVFPSPDLENQYFPPDIPGWKIPLRFIDCGAFDGDTMQYISGKGIPVESAALFEPDPVNFSKLVRYLSSLNDTPVCFFPCAVYSATQRLYFSLNEGESSKVIDSGNTAVQAVALDDVLYAFRPNLIKMDIEGAEIEGLTGAKRIIHESRPGLAISVYHHPCHLWQIPLLVKGWDLGYRFFLRVHAYNGFEAVMYAVPGEK